MSLSRFVPTPGFVSRYVLTTFALVLLAGIGLTLGSEELRTRATRRTAFDIAQAQAYALERQVQRSLLSTYALAAIMRRSREPDGTISDFEPLAADMIRSYGGIRALEIAPRGIIRQVYPLKGNEAAVGLDLIRNPRRRDGALATMRSGQLSLIGPFPLVQGGVGALGLLPVFDEERRPQRANRGQFQGFVLAVIDMDDLLQSVNIRQMAQRGYSWELGHITKTGNTAQIFARSQGRPLDSPVTVPLRVPNAQWQLRVSPQGGWGRETSLFFKLLLSLAMAALCASVAGAYARQTLQRRTAEESYRDIFENAVEGIYRTSADGQYLTVNPAMVRLFGYNTARHLMAQVKTFQNHAWIARERLDEFVRVLEERGEVEGWEMEVGRHGGGEVWVSVNARVSSVGGATSYIEGIVTDVTERKQAEALRHTLTDMIVHDLRTPLTSLLFSLNTMALKCQLDPNQQRHLEVAQQGARISLEMVEDLLDISRLEAGFSIVDTSTFDPHLLLNEALNRLEPLAAHANVRLQLQAEPLPLMFGDRDKLLRTLVNLLDNAVKFTPPGGTVSLSAQKTASGDTLCFAVSDEGEGIAKEWLARIFDKFGQVPTLNRQRRSSGLGLAFCKMVVEAHGGHIEVESEVGQGSTFRFWIPQ